jgi:hypothetical protein
VLQRVGRDDEAGLLGHLAYRRRFGLLTRLDVPAEPDPLAFAEARLLEPEQYLPTGR